ncbi:MAG: hypothetical protein P1P63_05210 [Treponemataceae bacterium]
MKKTLCVILGLFFFVNLVFAQENFKEKTQESEKNKHSVLIASNGTSEKTGDSDSTESKTEGAVRPANRQYASPAALIIVILIFVVLFAWPPIFMKWVARKEKE